MLRKGSFGRRSKRPEREESNGKYEKSVEESDTSVMRRWVDGCFKVIFTERTFEFRSHRKTARYYRYRRRRGALWNSPHQHLCSTRMLSASPPHPIHIRRAPCAPSLHCVCATPKRSCSTIAHLTSLRGGAYAVQARCTRGAPDVDRVWRRGAEDTGGAEVLMR